jgi:hypothetical protein
MNKDCSICYNEMIYINSLEGTYWICEYCSNIELNYDTTNNDIWKSSVEEARTSDQRKDI